MFNIKKFEDNKLDRIMEIWKLSTIKAHAFISKEYWEKNYDIVKNVYIPMADTFVYDDGGEIKGFISIINNEFIGALFIDIDCQNLGIGSQLIEYVSSRYRKLELAVYKDNQKATKFYQNHGFKIIREQKNEDSGFQEYIMEKIN